MNIPTIEELDRIGLKAANIADAAPTPSTVKYLTAIRDAVVAACRPQLLPIEEMPEEVPEGCVRKFTVGPNWWFTDDNFPEYTHYIDIALPEPTYPADFEAAFAKANLDPRDKAAAFKLWKGGAR